jgi:hypothetical protein
MGFIESYISDISVLKKDHQRGTVRAAPSAAMWIPSPQGVTKINVDGAVSKKTQAKVQRRLLHETRQEII